MSRVRHEGVEMNPGLRRAYRNACIRHLGSGPPEDWSREQLANRVRWLRQVGRAREALGAIVGWLAADKRP